MPPKRRGSSPRDTKTSPKGRGADRSLSPRLGHFSTETSAQRENRKGLALLNNDLEACYNQISEYIDCEINKKKSSYDVNLIKNHIKKLIF